MNDMLEKMKAFLDSEEGERVTDEFFKKMEKEAEHFDRWKNKVIEKISVLSDGELSQLLDSFYLHNKKQTDIKYSQGIDGESSLCEVIFQAFLEIGAEYESGKMFSAAAYEFRGYVAELFIGQGSFITITKK